MLHKNTQLNLYVIRHGQSVANLESKLLYGRSNEIVLTQKGERQATNLGKRMKRKRIKIDYAYSSIAQRALMTAENVLKEIDFSLEELIKTEDLVEYSIGEWAGKIRDEVYTSEIRGSMNIMGPYFTPPKGESLMMVQRRILPWLFDEIIYNEKYLGKKVNIAVFSHAMTIRVLLHYVMGFNDRLVHRIGIDNASLTKLRFTEDGWYVDYVNR